MELEIGKYNILEVIKQLDFGIYLDGLDRGEILMPKQYVPAGTEIGDKIEAFIYFDSEDRIIATTLKPFATVGQFAALKVVAANQTGAFLDWGLMKDLFVPFKEQKVRMTQGQSYIVMVYCDSVSDRIVGTSKFEAYLNREPAEYTVGEEVELLIYQKSDIGYKAVVNQQHLGIIHNSDIFKNIETGTKTIGYIKTLKEDGKIDLLLQKPGYSAIDDVAQSILNKAKEHRNFLPLSDKSSAEEIYQHLGISKKSFKKAIGQLYKNRLVAIEDNGVRVL